MIPKKYSYLFLIALLVVLLYFGFPLVFSSTVLTLGLQLILYPMFSFVSSLLYTVKYGIHPALPIITGVFYLPAGLLYYHSVMLSNVALYCAVSFFALVIGYTIHKKYERT